MTGAHAPEPGSQHEPASGWQVKFPQGPFCVVPAERAQSAGSRLWHILQQQHAGAGFAQLGKTAQVEFGPPKTPPIVAQVVGAAWEQMFVDGSQQAPATSCAQVAATHGAPGPNHTPALARHSQLRACVQLA
jgi:hypothetical protein